jgi:hypothetical protein
LHLCSIALINLIFCLFDVFLLFKEGTCKGVHSFYEIILSQFIIFEKIVEFDETIALLFS